MVDGEDLDAFVARVVIMAVFYYHPFCLLWVYPITILHLLFV